MTAKKESKKIYNNSALFILNFFNIILGIKNGFNIFTILGIILSSIVFFLDVLEYFSE